MANMNKDPHELSNITKDRENRDTDDLIKDHQAHEAPSYSQWVEEQVGDADE